MSSNTMQDSCERKLGDLSIRVCNVFKDFFIYKKPEDRFRQMVVPPLFRLFNRSHRNYFQKFAALHDISFEVYRGETIGIIGRNGAGKSTLLQILCGTLTPSSGLVEVNGRVAALLELGAGFNPEFTGRENVFLNAAILGLSREETQERFDAIASFADIGEFLDLQVKTYSSGMYVRLAFAVQAQIDPDILIVDEALAVGDVRFQAKCFARLKALRDQGTTVLMVTHSTEQIVTHCDRAILLEHGKKTDEGKPRQVVNRYLDLLYGRAPLPTRKTFADCCVPEKQSKQSASLDERLTVADQNFTNRTESFFSERSLYNKNEYRWGDQRGELMDFFLFANDEPFPPIILSGSRLVLYVRYRAAQNIVRPIIGFALKTKEGVTVYGTNTEVGELSGTLPDAHAGETFIICFETEILCGGGDYFMSIGLASRDVNGDVVPHDRRYDSIHLHVAQGQGFSGLYDFRARMNVHAND